MAWIVQPVRQTVHFPPNHSPSSAPWPLIGGSNYMIFIHIHNSSIFGDLCHGISGPSSEKIVSRGCAEDSRPPVSPTTHPRLSLICTLGDLHWRCTHAASASVMRLSMHPPNSPGWGSSKFGPYPAGARLNYTHSVISIKEGPCGPSVRSVLQVVCSPV